MDNLAYYELKEQIADQAQVIAQQRDLITAMAAERDNALLNAQAAKDMHDQVLQDFSFLEIENRELETERDNALRRVEELENRLAALDTPYPGRPF